MKKPRHSFRDRPARKAAQLRQFAGKLHQNTLDELLATFETDSKRRIALDLLRPHLNFTPLTAGERAIAVALAEAVAADIERQVEADAAAALTDAVAALARVECEQFLDCR